MTKPSLLLLGAGNMGGALLRAWLDEGSINAARSAVVDPNPSGEIADLCDRYGVALNPVTDPSVDVCVLAVKPQMFPDVLPSLALPDGSRTLYVSIAAGTTLRAIRNLLKGQADAPKVVRTMPSLPAQVRRGITLLTAEDDVTEAERAVVTALMAAAGTTHWCADEDELDRLMGVTGCSPAFVFLLAEALADAARAQGADDAAARRLGEAAVTGAAALLAADGRDAATLRRAVTSPGGTTAAALGVLDGEQGLRPLTDEAVSAAYERAKELAG